MEITINEVFRNRVKRYGDRIAIEKKRAGAWESASWTAYYDAARAVGMAFHAMGIRKGDRIGLISENRLEWLYTDMGTLGIGACLVPLYATLTADEVVYITDHADARILVVEDDAQLAKAEAALSQCPALEHVVVMDSETDTHGEPRISRFSDLLADGRKAAEDAPGMFERLADHVAPGDLATLVYTSGTTGVPKGAMITHNNIMAVLRALNAIRPAYACDTDRTVPFLPLSHVFERAAGHFYGMYVGITASYAEDVNSLLSDFAEKRPTMILAVPAYAKKCTSGYS